MKKIFGIIFLLLSLTGFSQVVRPTTDWSISATNITLSGTLTATTASIGTLGVTGTATVGSTLGVTGALTAPTLNTGQGANELYDMDQNVQTTDSPSFTGVTVSTATITTLAVTGEASTQTLTTTGPVTASGDVTGGNLVTTGNLSVTGIGATASLTVTGSHTVTGYLNPQGPVYADSSLYFGCDYSNTWMRFFYQQVGMPRSRGVIENMADYYIQAKDGLSQVLAIQRDTSLTESGVNHLNVVKQVYLGKDTTGIGSTANIGTTLYYNGHFYGLIESTPPSWKQLDN
jgi:hypothetical protein